MFTRLLLSTVLVGLTTATLAQQIMPPAVPYAIKAPAGEKVILVAHATGSQIYSCQAGADGTFGWILKAPDAQLHDEMGAIIGYHSAGPTWKLDDGSGVKGKAVAKVDHPDAIPWLLVTVVEHTGAGKLGRVTSIQRVNTRNGMAPASGCDASNQGKETKSSYTADYYFYAPK